MPGTGHWNRATPPEPRRRRQQVAGAWQVFGRNPGSSTGDSFRAIPGLFPASRAPAPHDGADHSRVKQSEIDHPVATLVSRHGSPQCLSGPSSFFVDSSFSSFSFVFFRLFQASVAPALSCGSFESEQSEIDHPFATLASRRDSPQRLSGPSSSFVALGG